MRGKDISNQRFGLLIAIKPTDQRKNGSVVWECRCDCGNIHYATAAKLLSTTKSCGCVRKQKLSEMSKNSYKDLTNMTFGKLKVIAKTEQRASQGSIIWECLCECGNQVYVSSQDLLSGHNISCGCIHSKGEFIIKNILCENNISFKSQYHFDDLKDKGLLLFDFAIFRDNDLICLIEYDGRQHFGLSDGWNDAYNYEIIKLHDKMKNQYCKNKNIPLYRIPYFELNKISQVEDIFNNKFLLNNSYKA